MPEDDIRKMNNEPNKGFDDLDVNLEGTNYRNGKTESIPSDWDINKPCPYDGGKKDGDADNTTPDPRTYFYKGFGDADCIQYLFDLGIITGE
ncbi:MAG: hypothetical protein ACLFPH_09200 [Bacteroidales bacterium]